MKKRRWENQKLKQRTQNNMKRKSAALLAWVKYLPLKIQWRYDDEHIATDTTGIKWSDSSEEIIRQSKFELNWKMTRFDCRQNIAVAWCRYKIIMTWIRTSLWQFRDCFHHHIITAIQWKKHDMHAKITMKILCKRKTALRLIFCHSVKRIWIINVGYYYHFGQSNRFFSSNLLQFWYLKHEYWWVSVSRYRIWKMLINSFKCTLKQSFIIPIWKRLRMSSINFVVCTLLPVNNQDSIELSSWGHWFAFHST